MLGVVCFIPSPPLFVFIGGSHGQGECVLQLILQEPTSTSNQELPRRRLKSVGPTGWSADHLVAQPTSAFFGWVLFWAHMSLALVLASGMSVSCSGGPSKPCSDMCRVLIRWNVVSWVMPHHYATKLAKNHLHTF